MIEIRQPRIETAIDVVDDEIAVVQDEKRAFEAFLSRLAECNTGRRSTGTALASGNRAGATYQVGDHGTGASIEQVRTAYRETVMDVTHYEADYGDSLADNVGVEFGPDLSECVTQDASLSPVVKGALLEAGREAKSERVRFLGLLRRERSSLSRVEAELDDVEERAMQLGEKLDDVEERAMQLGEKLDDARGDDDDVARVESELRELLDRAGAVADRRQETIHERSVGTLSGIDGDSLAAHLYADFETTCPALADVADCVATIHHALDRAGERSGGRSSRPDPAAGHPSEMSR